MWQIEKIIKKGDYQYAIVRDHPHRTKNDYVLLHRIILENKLGRLLNKNEIAHHKDENKKNNNPDNLEPIESHSKHAILHGKSRLKNLVELCCPQCKTIFIKARNQSFLCKPQKYPVNFCSERCRGLFCQKLSINKCLTNEQELSIKNCLIKEFKGKI